MVRLTLFACIVRVGFFYCLLIGTYSLNYLNTCSSVYRERIERMKEEDRLEKEAAERRLRRDLITKTFPKTREDFDQLYAMVS